MTDLRLRSGRPEDALPDAPCQTTGDQCVVEGIIATRDNNSRESGIS